MIYLHKDYTQLVKYNFSNNKYEIINYDKQIDKKTQGKADILDGKFIAIFVFKEILYLATDKIQIDIDIDKLSMDLLSRDLNDNLLERTLILKKEDFVVDTLVYQIDKTIITNQIMYTEMAEVEDFDFGLFLANNVMDREWQQRFLQRIKEKSTLA